MKLRNQSCQLILGHYTILSRISAGVDAGDFLQCAYVFLFSL